MATGPNATLEIHLLGDFRLVFDGMPVAGVDTPRLQSLLAYLVLHRNAAQPRSHLAFTFWLDSTEAQAHTNLRKQVYHLRRALPDADQFLYTDTKVLQWRPDAPFRLDVADFESALEGADRAERDGDQPALRDSLERAVALYQGDLLPSSYEDWVLAERQRLRQQFSAALERLIRLLESHRDYQAAIGYAQRLLRHDPLREETYRRLMRLYALSGDRARALRAYHTCATVLQRELGVEPSAATREAYERLVTIEAPHVPAPAPEKLGPVSPLVGRDGEWQQLQEAWRAASGGMPHLVILTGEAGIGKTRLAEELLDWASRQGVPTASARCYASGGGLAYASVTAWLRAQALQGAVLSLDDVWLGEVSRLLPELLVERPEIPPPGPLTETWQRQRLFEALARAFLQRRQLLLLLDDVQWCDAETLEWLPYLLRAGMSGRPNGTPSSSPRPSGGSRSSPRDGGEQVQLLIASTLRREDMPAGGPLASLLRDLRRRGQLTEVELGPLDEAAAVSLAANEAGRQLDPDLAADLYRETEGNPLFVLETVRAGLPILQAPEPKTGTEDLPGGARRWPLPPVVQEAILARLAQLSPIARELVNVAATIGREFTFDVVHRASLQQGTATLEDDAGEEALVCALDELWQRHIVRERGAESYDFSHDTIREVAYAELSGVRRRFLHRRVAEALVTVHGGDPSTPALRPGSGRGLDAVSHQVALHYERAGLPDRAVPYYERAAEAAQEVYANDAAIGYYRQALACLPEGAEAAARCRLLEALGRILRRQARYVEAEEAFTAMRAAAEAAGDAVAEARAWNRLSDVQRSRSLHQAALESARRAEAVARTAGPGAAGQVEVAMALFAQGWALFHLGDATGALALGEEALALSAELGPQGRPVMARSENLLGVTYKMLGEYRRSLHHQEQALALFREEGDERRVAGMLSNLGETARQWGDFGKAIGLYRQALDAAEKMGERDWEMAFLSNLGGAQVGLGNYQAAEANLRQALNMAEEAGEEGLCETHSFLAEAFLGQAKTSEALAAAQRALALAQASGEQLQVGIAWRALGRVAARLDEPLDAGDERADAETCFAESLRIFRELGAETEEVRTIEVWAFADPETLPPL